MPALIELSFTADTQIRTTDLTIQIPSNYQCANEPQTRESKLNYLIKYCSILLLNVFTFKNDVVSTMLVWEIPVYTE